MTAVTFRLLAVLEDLASKKTTVALILSTTLTIVALKTTPTVLTTSILVNLAALMAIPKIQPGKEATIRTSSMRNPPTDLISVKITMTAMVMAMNKIATVMIATQTHTMTLILSPLMVPTLVLVTSAQPSAPMVPTTAPTTMFLTTALATTVLTTALATMDTATALATMDPTTTLVIMVPTTAPTTMDWTQVQTIAILTMTLVTAPAKVLASVMVPTQTFTALATMVWTLVHQTMALLMIVSTTALVTMVPATALATMNPATVLATMDPTTTLVTMVPTTAPTTMDWTQVQALATEAARELPSIHPNCQTMLAMVKTLAPTTVLTMALILTVKLIRVPPLALAMAPAKVKPSVQMTRGSLMVPTITVSSDLESLLI